MVTPCLADDGWDRAAHALSIFSCIVLLLGAVVAVWSRIGAIVLAIIVGGPATFFTALIFNDNVLSLWVAYLICYFVFLFCCAIGVLRSIGSTRESPAQRSMPPNTSLERTRDR